MGVSGVILSGPLSLISSPPSPVLVSDSKVVRLMLSPKPKGLQLRPRFRVRAFMFDPTKDPIIKDVLKEPVAFMGGMFAGLLRLDLNEEPLKEWISKTAEAAGISEEEVKPGADVQSEEVPMQIDIE